MRPPTPLELRLAEKIEVDDSGCWIFTGRVNNRGYGRIWSGPGGRVVYAHRAAYETFRGAIPEGLELDHLCRVTRCCNPDHLEAVTRRVNTIRSLSPVAANASKVECIHGHAFDEANTYVWRGHRKCRACDRATQQRKRESLV